MSNNKFRLFICGLILISISLESYGQTRQEKTDYIVKMMNIIENHRANYEFQLEPIKYQATGNDSIRIIELEKKVTEQEIIKKINLAFSEIFNDEEISDFYDFIQSSAFDKFFYSEETNKVISAQFSDIDKEIEEITRNFSEIVEKPTEKFEPITVDKEDGFYATVDYNNSTVDKNIKLEDKPSLTSKDILEVKKTFSSNNDIPEINIVFTKDGARKFYLLTKKNIGKPIAIVIAKQIVSMPKVNSEIMGGKASISGGYSEEEIDKMIEILKGK